MRAMIVLLLIGMLIFPAFAEDPAAPFNLQPTSPAIGHGLVSDGPSRDLYGNPRVDAQGNLRNDCGAIQYVETAPPPPPPVNTAPSVVISSPADGSFFSEGVAILFNGQASDIEDGSISDKLVWDSNLVGQIGTGPSFQCSLPPGSHDIVASVTDSGGLQGFGISSIVVKAVPSPNSAPTVSITSPASGATYNSKTRVVFSAEASDAEDGGLGPKISWTSSLIGNIGTGPYFTRTMPVGMHVITAKVTDSGGLTTNDDVLLIIIKFRKK